MRGAQQYPAPPLLLLLLLRFRLRPHPATIGAGLDVLSSLRTAEETSFPSLFSPPFYHGVVFGRGKGGGGGAVF